jgi:hypothetical protein
MKCRHLLLGGVAAVAPSFAARAETARFVACGPLGTGDSGEGLGREARLEDEAQQGKHDQGGAGDDETAERDRP